MAFLKSCSPKRMVHTENNSSEKTSLFSMPISNILAWLNISKYSFSHHLVQFHEFCIMQYISQKILQCPFFQYCAAIIHTVIYLARVEGVFDSLKSPWNQIWQVLLIFYGMLWILLGLRHVCLKYDTKGFIVFKKLMCAHGSRNISK